MVNRPEVLKIPVGIYGPPAWTLPARYVEGLRTRFPDIEFVHANSDEELKQALRDADATFSSVVREDAFRGATKLRWIHASSAGIGSTLFPDLIESDVVLTNSRGVMSRWIAEHILAVVLAWQRGLHTSVRRQVQGVWAQDEIANWQRPTLRDTRALIVGLGSIGGETAGLLRAAGLHVDGIGRARRGDRPGVESLPDLLPSADVVAIAAPHTKETIHLFDRAMLARMKEGSLLINVGRGKIIDEAALVEALRQGRPGGAALDVFEHEPLAAGSPLWSMENVIITPHVAGFGHRFWESMVELFARNLERYLKGEPLENVVDKRKGY